MTLGWTVAALASTVTATGATLIDESGVTTSAFDTSPLPLQ